MGDFMDFFDLSKNLQRVHVAGGQTQGHAVVKDEEMFEEPNFMSRPYKGVEYAKKYQARERKEMLEMCREEAASTTVCGLGDIDDATSIGASAMTEVGQLMRSEELTRVYTQYDFTRKKKVTLPISSSEAKILKVVDSSQACVIVGNTGCGKSTQVPQYILDDGHKKNLPRNIVVTQPRRIAAISLAKRVCAERDWELGTLVGYQVGLDRDHQSDDSRLLYVTTGVLLQMLMSDKHLNKFTHIVLDEVHERSLDMDFLLIVIKRYLYTNSRHVKVILMSATIDGTKFTEYFPTASAADLSLYPTTLVSLTTAENDFHVETFYLCSLKNLGIVMPDIRWEEPGISFDGYRLAVKLIETFDELEKAPNQFKQRGAVLVFLPGIHEIEELYKMLEEKAGTNKWWVKVLHSSITSDEQELVFKRPPEGCRKIILSTNIAESSITVPDITFVVDFVLTKEMVCDPSTNFQSLQLKWASKNNCVQRAGRAGRVAAGRVFRLVPKRFFEDMLLQEAVPEMERGSLERTILQAKTLEIGSPRSILALALSPPDLTKIEQTILMLKEKGALLITCKGKESEIDGDLTYLGRVMAKLPVDPVISKLIVLGHMFSVLPECIIMGAAMSLKSVFSAPFQERLKAYHSKLTWADSSCSDCIAFLNAYTVWEKNKEIGYFKRSVGGGEADWAKRYYIQIRTLHEVHLLIEDLHKRLRDFNIEIPKGVGRVQLTNIEKPLVLKIVLAGAFYPNYFARSSMGGQVDEREAVKLLDGRDPFSTVYLQNFPRDQPRRLYAKRIRDMLYDCCPDIKVSFDNSSKVYVHFGQHHQFPSMLVHNHNYVATIPGKVALGVYRAVKFRQLAIPIMIPILRPAEAKTRARELGLPTSEVEALSIGRQSVENGNGDNEYRCVKRNPLPSIDTTVVQFIISHVVDAGHFWAQAVDTNATDQQRFMYGALRDVRNLVPIIGEAEVGKTYAAPYFDEYNQYQYYRARIERKTRKGKHTMVQVFYVDFGNSVTINVNELMDFNSKLLKAGILEVPVQAFECVLAQIQPSVTRCQGGLWSDEANAAFNAKVFQKHCYGEVYSVVNGVIHLTLKLLNSFNINEWLISQGYAVEAEEGFLSQENHRVRMLPLEPYQALHYEEQQETQRMFAPVENYVEPPSTSECYMSHKLRGPSSPLEMQVYSLTRIGQRREVAIEKESVNSVLLDTDPQDPHERLLVAACVGENATSDRLTLRHTTLMPNIHGLAALICLVFAPVVEFRTDANRSRYTGALCGLGFQGNTGKSVFPDHDMEVTFDTEYTLEDITDINRLRMWMNECLVPEDEDVFVSEKSILNAQINIKRILFKLIQRKPVSCEPVICPRPMYWQALDPKYFVCPIDDGSLNLLKQGRAVFRMHWPVRMKLTESEQAKNMMLLENINQLKRIAVGLTDESLPNRCFLCDVQLEKRSAVRAHLATLQHRENDRKLVMEIDADKMEQD